MNLLLAAAVAGVHTDEDNSSSDDEGNKQSLTLDKAMELWTKHKTQDGLKNISWEYSQNLWQIY